VWLPTNDSEANVKRSKQQRPFVPVIQDGKVLPDVIKVFGIIAKNNLVLETGHSSPSESLILIAEAKRQGVQNILVTHAFANPGGSMSIAEAQEAAKLGAYIELVYDPSMMRRCSTMLTPSAPSAPHRAYCRVILGSGAVPCIPTGCWRSTRR